MTITNIAAFFLSLLLFGLQSDFADSKQAMDRAKEEYGALRMARISNDIKAAESHAANLFTTVTGAYRQMTLGSVVAKAVAVMLGCLMALNLFWLWKLIRTNSP